MCTSAPSCPANSISLSTGARTALGNRSCSSARCNVVPGSCVRGTGPTKASAVLAAFSTDNWQCSTVARHCWAARFWIASARKPWATFSLYCAAGLACTLTHSRRATMVRWAASPNASRSPPEFAPVEDLVVRCVAAALGAAALRIRTDHKEPARRSRHRSTRTTPGPATAPAFSREWIRARATPAEGVASTASIGRRSWRADLSRSPRGHSRCSPMLRRVHATRRALPLRVARREPRRL